MPKQTFFNLPEEKRQALVDIAIDEFARNNYRSASVSHIVARAGIAKGSIYQYFEDKRDLFLYLVDLAAQEKAAFLRQLSPEPGMNFFDYLRWLAAAGTKATFSNPRLAQLGYRAYYADLPFHDELIARAKEQSISYLSQLVQDAIAKGDIDPAVDLEMAAFLINTMVSELGNFVFHRQGIDPLQIGREGLQEVDMGLVERTFDEFVHILQHGLGNPTRAGQP